MLQHFKQNQQSKTLVHALTSRLGVATIVAAGVGFASPVYAVGFFVPGDLVVSGSTYAGTANDPNLIPGQTKLPGGGKAVNNGSYPGVFNNDTPDASFGVTSPIFLQEFTTSGINVGTVNVDPSVITTSFSSKSELAINLTADGTGLTFMGYAAPINQLDVSNSNTPGIIDPNNPVTGNTANTYRAVAQINYNTPIVNGVITPEISTTNAYSGNNGRAAILAANGDYYTVGNAGNGTKTTPSNIYTAITNATGVQIVTPGQTATATTPTDQVGQYNVTQNNQPADKVGKDNNFRGETIFNNTLYVTKGSGSNGINSVYQVGTAGTLPTANAPITILPGFPTNLASSTTGTVYHPFGIWFANATTLYVADEGDGFLTTTGATAAQNLTNSLADAASSTIAGLEKWTLGTNGQWTMDYVLQSGLNLGYPSYTATSTLNGVSVSYQAATDGLRNLTGEVNADGTVSLYAVTSTVSSNGDPGADPNELVAITDTLSDTTATQASSEKFSVIDGPTYGTVLRGVSFAPVPEPSSILGSLGALGWGVLFVRRFRARKIASL